MEDIQKRVNAKRFVEFWENHSKKEKQDDQTFWNMFLRDILDVETPERIIQYQKETDSDKTQWIDAYIKSTGVIIEQKSSGVDLLKKYLVANNEMMTPYEQAKNYDNNMNKSNKANWIITCNFDEFHIYDMNDIRKEYTAIKIEDLPSCYDIFSFMINKEAKVHDLGETISKEAGKIIGNIYNEIEKLLKDADLLNERTSKHLNMFCVRLVFCFFAEDSGLFSKGAFRDYIEKADINHLQSDLMELFKVLNMKERTPFLREDLRDFPYVNGELFEETIDIPPLNDKIKSLILDDACDNFDWSKINPTIFGAIFESTLNPDTRRSGGMHYTSLENIHKVIDPLFLNDLTKEFADIRKSSQVNIKKKKYEELQNKISNLRFLDPACGSGNFLTETYIQLRKLENNILRELIILNKGQRSFFSSDCKDLIKVHIQQFYGIEINDFAVAVSKTALWIAEYQMYLETIDLDSSSYESDFLPLDSYDNIVEGNALKLNWNDVISNSQCSYIMGNPPFIGARKMKENSEQKREIRSLFSDLEAGLVQDLDYVCGWYAKASQYIQDTKIQAGLVSTNSICQGVQATILWNWLANHYPIIINYCYRSFKWTSEANDVAAVDCIIVGFGFEKIDNKIIYDGNDFKIASNINQYLLDGTDISVEPHKDAINGAKKMNSGNQPRDGGHFVIKEQEYNYIVKNHKEVMEYLHPYIGADEYIKNKKRWCLWLKDVEPNIIRNNQFLREKVKQVYDFRIKSSAKTTNGYARVPHQFAQITQPLGIDYIIIPRHTTSSRNYIPIGFMKGDTISSDAVSIIPKATVYEFGILTSSVHMAWMKTVCGRLGNEYRYSKEIVYNNFPWPTPTKTQVDKIITTANEILEVRNQYKNCSLADLYDEYSMPNDLKLAHRKNDMAVMNAYGFNQKMTEYDWVEKLMEMYRQMVEKQENN